MKDGFTFDGPVSLRTTGLILGFGRRSAECRQHPIARSTRQLAQRDDMFMQFNQVIGATYKISSDVTAYAGFSEVDRTPTPSELGCANPAQPCIIASFLVSDPPLKQLIAHTFEAGLRGTHNYGEDLGTFGGAPFTDPRTLNPAQPHSVCASLKDTF
jgi:hypothetical protein